MEIDQDKLKEKIIQAKKSIAYMYHNKDKEVIGRLEKLNKEICLVVAEFKCQSCGKEDELQIHHLIMRNMKKFMDFFRYASQRYYWANQLVLCKSCHVKAHKAAMEYHESDESLCIKESDINKVKKQYEDKKL